ncbi:tetratricopeptide repeat protein 5-like [Varroa jacobsoni]|uniref:tetratricopeptide repeat protein 5-like n=1 Tax=Varroa jacobsoni TaxID=62625 RepID=UPI000BF5C5D4|nr:tetratricopeptide repeat protein 5-like [Varroa jacobsoni]
MAEEEQPPGKFLADFGDAVMEMYRKRNMFYQQNPSACEADLEKMLDAEIKRILEQFEPKLTSLKGTDKSVAFMLVGRVHNVRSTHSKLAEEFLYKAVKMNPMLSDAWNELGECYYKGGQADKALNCFQCVLKHVQDKKALRNLSIILRSQDRLTASSLQDSVQRSREALQLDFDDGASWYNLGNAYLTTFFHRGQQEKDLLQALSCYKKALHDEDQKSNPDLHYSLAEASRYTENFQTALDSYVASHRFNPSWTVPLDKADNLEMYLKELDEAVRSKGKMRPRKLEQLVKNVKPHHDKAFGGSVKKSLAELTSSDERVGVAGTAERPNVYVLLKVVATLSSRALAFTCCAVDEHLECVAVSVFNFDEGRAMAVGDTLAIARPVLRAHNVTLRGGARASFRLLRVTDPRTLAVNGRPIPNEWETHFK